MLKRSLPAVIVLLGLCLPLAAQRPADATTMIASDGLRITAETAVAPALTLERHDLFETVDDAVLLQGLQAMTLRDAWRLPHSAEMGRTGSRVADYRVGLVNAVEAKKKRPSLLHPSESSVDAADFRVRGIEYGGEVGFFYGRSTGKYGAEEMGAYIISGAGNDKFNIEVGVSYRETTFRGVPTFR
jgi:hypothetical protein